MFSAGHGSSDQEIHPRYPPQFYLPQHQPSPLKRRKIEVACEVCRLRKSRCDGARPKCGACQRRRNVGPVCVYQTHGTPPDNRQSYEAIVSPGANSEGHLASQSQPEQAGWMLKAGLLAASSSSKFFHTIFGDTNHNDGQSDTSTPRRTNVDSPVTDTTTVAADTTTCRASDRVLPARRTADSLLQRFFDHVYIQWFDKPRFVKWYETLWTAEAQDCDALDDQINHALLNIILALVYRTEPEVIDEEQDQLAEVHFLRARRLIQLDVSSLDRINYLYTLFMFIQWYQSVNDVQQCGKLVRLCILVAQNLCLDSEATISALQNQRAREMARRAWQGCILIDRIIAMVSNQPPAIPQSIARTATMFQAIDDEHLGTSTDGKQPLHTISSHSFYLAFCQLHLILGDMLQNAQERNLETSFKIDLDHILDIEQRLTSFHLGLPLQLQFDTAASTPDAYSGQRVHLQTRFLYIRILLHRPFFLRAIDMRDKAAKSSKFAKAITVQGLITCIETAQELLTLLASRFSKGEESPRYIPQWWHTIAYVYSAATVVIAAHGFIGLMSQVTTETLAASINQGFDVLDTLAKHKETAERCRTALRILYDRQLEQLRGASEPDETADPAHNDDDEASKAMFDFSWAFADPFDMFRDHVEGGSTLFSF